MNRSDYVMRLLLPQAAILVCLLLLVHTDGPFAPRLGEGDSEMSPRPAVYGEEEGEGSEGVDWFYAQRAYPLRTTPVGARVQALRQLELAERDLHRPYGAGLAPQQLATLQTQWVSIGPAPIREGQTFGVPKVAVSGRVSAIALDPGYDGSSNSTVYMGAAQGGLWRSTDDGARWVPLTDDQPSLAVGAIAIDPFRPQVIYVGTGEGSRSGDTYYGAGLLKSVDGGSTWSQIVGPVSTTPPREGAFINATFSRIQIDPRSTSVLYAATSFGYTWGASGGQGSAPQGDRGVWKSVDAGQTWRNLNPTGFGLYLSGTDVMIDPLNSDRVFAAILNYGVYRSNAAGEPGSWERLAGGLPDPGPADEPNFKRIILASGPPLPPSTRSTVYAAFGAANNDLLGIFRSFDDGNTWSKLNNPPAGAQANYSLALAVDPLDGNIVYYGTTADVINAGGTLWRSRDGGISWSDLSTGNGTGGLHADTHAIVVSPRNRNIVFTANDGGVWRTSNGLDSLVGWTTLNLSLSITQFQSIALHPTDPNVILGGTQDNGTDRYDGNPAWFQSRAGDGGFALIDQSNPQVMYHTFFNQSNAGGRRAQIGPEISLDGGTSWLRRGCFGCTAQLGGFNPSDRMSYYAPMALHAGFTGSSGNVIYFGTNRLYRSADQGLTWTGLGSSGDGFGMDLTRGSPPDVSGFSFAVISSITAHTSLDNGSSPAGETVWVGTGDGLVQVTTSAGALGGARFVDTTKGPLPGRFVTDIAIDPSDPRRAIVAYSGFNANTPGRPGHIFETSDLGGSWADISGNLPDIPVTSIVVDPLLEGTIYAGTDLGVFQSSDRGATWVRLGQGMPRVAVFMLRYHAASRSLVAATHGRGIFRLALPGAVVSVSAASYRRTDLAIEGIAAAFGTNLATATVPAETTPLPTELGGTRISIRDSRGASRPAPLLLVSPTQINYEVPPSVPTLLRHFLVL